MNRQGQRFKRSICQNVMDGNVGGKMNLSLRRKDFIKEITGVPRNLEEQVIFGGRLGEYKYYDMDQVIAAALERAEGCVGRKRR